MKKLIRTSTIGLSLNIFCNGLLRELSAEGYEVVALSSPDADLEIVGKREGVKAIGVEMERRISLLKDLKSLMRLIKVFREEKPDMVHSITPKAGLLSMIAARIAGVPVRLHTFTGLVFPTSIGLKRKILMLTDKITCRCATHILAEGSGVKNDLISNSITKKEVRVLGYGNLRGIDLDFYCRAPEVESRAKEIRARLNASGDTFVFVFIGRFAGDKGVDNLMAAFDVLIKEGHDVRLIMTGDFEGQDPLKPSTIHMMKKSPYVLKSSGWVNDVRPYLAAADALVFPSRREGFPNVVIEAGALDIPSIVTDINGSREIIVPGINGSIVPPDDFDALLREMRRFIENRDFVKGLSSESRRMVAERYEQSFVRNNLKEYYREIQYQSVIHSGESISRPHF